MPKKEVLCELCREAFIEDGCPPDAVITMLHMGGSIADHLCERIEVGLEVRCDCPCKD